VVNQGENVNYILNFEWNGWLGIALYWVPLVFCVVFYTARTAEGYMKDKRAREDAYLKRAANGTGFYYPEETLGRILGRAVVSVCPVANLWAALFDLSPKVFGRFFNLLSRVFDQPLVPPLK
jgi:hypothetical protein